MTILDWLTIANTVGLVFLFWALLAHVGAHTILYEVLDQVVEDVDAIITPSPRKRSS